MKRRVNIGSAMFADAALAARVDRAEGRLGGRLAEWVGSRRPESRSIVLPIWGGLAVYASPASPINKVIGVGFDAPPDLDALGEVERQWRERGEPVRVELSNLANPEVGSALTARGYGLHGFENVLGRSLENIGTEPPANGISIGIVCDKDVRTWIDVAVEAFMDLDGTGSVADDALPREELQRALDELADAPGGIRYLARIDGRAVGEAALHIDGDLALVAGAGTLPPFRGRGVQKALLYRRLADARAAGCTHAVVTTAPGTRSQDNVMRRGFALLYTRAILIRRWE